MSENTFFDRVTITPAPFDPDRAADRLKDLRAKAAGALTFPGAEAFFAGVAGCSPYLSRIMVRDAAALPMLFSVAPENAMETLVAETGALGRDAPDRAALMRGLREVKRKAALLIACADIGGVWDLEQVTGALTAIADATLGAATRWLLAQEVARGKLALEGDNPASGSGYAVIAMGKHGAGELNYSSDIDLVVFFDQDRWPVDDYAHVKDRLNRVTRDLVKVMQEQTEDGYVFRMDLRLRPDPGATPPCMDMDAAERYYESLGKNWERGAYIKARPVAGDLNAGGDFLKRIQPFVWRKYLDFAAIEDVHNMKKLIHAHKGHGEIRVAGHDVKLGRGGIREIEFFAQTQQLISGGRNPALREMTTVGALAALTESGWVAPEARDTLTEDYRFFRTVEHRIQMIDDAHTHRIPEAGPGLDRLACFLGYADARAFAADIEPRLTRTAERFRRLFETEATLAEQKGDWTLTLDGPDAEGEAALADIGYAEPARALAILRGWVAGRMAATRSERARTKLDRLTPVIALKMAEALSPDHALLQFDRFLSGLPAGVQIFSLFESNPQLLDLLAEIFGAAPKLAEYLGRTSGVLDAVLSPDFFEAPPDRATMLGELRGVLTRQPDFERVLDASRRWARERQFQIGVQVLRGLEDAPQAGPDFSSIAEAMISGLEPYVSAEFTEKHGPPPGAGVVVVAMGKLGSREMTAESDLDLITIYDPGEATQSDGPKPLAVTQYYARWTQKFVSALTVPTSEGAVYEVDMRLRPSGRAGPLATALEAFRRYQKEDAWTWEHMALTRARIVQGPPALASRVEAAIREALTAPRDAQKAAAAALSMRSKLNDAHAKALDDPWSLKMTRGGLVDIEFIAQHLLLVKGLAGPATVNTRAALAVLKRAGALDAGMADSLLDALELQQAMMQVERVAIGPNFHPEDAAPGLKAAMARAAECDAFDQVEQRLRAAQSSVRSAFETVFGAPA